MAMLIDGQHDSAAVADLAKRRLRAKRAITKLRSSVFS
jgi:hypothetical protein